MVHLVLGRLLQSVLAIVGVLVIVFFMVRLTGDPAALMMSREASPQAVEAFRQAMGFNRPLAVQFADFVWGALRGDFGNSLHYRLPAIKLIRAFLPATLELAAVALVMAVIVAVPLGLAGGTRPGSLIDYAARGLGLLGQTVPGFWLALILILIFAVRLGWLPSSGKEQASAVIMPAFVLALPSMARLVRLTRSSVLEVMGQDYVRTAYSKGLSGRQVYYGHVLRNAAIPLVSLMGVQFSYMLGGSVVIETVFSWPGLGRLAAEAIGRRDFPLVQAVAFFTSVMVVSIQVLTEFMYGFIDPRIRRA